MASHRTGENVRIAGKALLDRDHEISKSWQPHSAVPELSVVMPCLNERRTPGTRWQFLCPGAILLSTGIAIALCVQRLPGVAA